MKDLNIYTTFSSSTQSPTICRVWGDMKKIKDLSIEASSGGLNNSKSIGSIYNVSFKGAKSIAPDYAAVFASSVENRYFANDTIFILENPISFSYKEDDADFPWLISFTMNSILQNAQFGDHARLMMLHISLAEVCDCSC